jgi:NADH-quinone oxidoreductase subunit E
LISRENVEKIIERHKFDKSALLAILQDIQDEVHYLPQDALIQVSQSLDIPLSQIYSVATFYKAFSLRPRGKHQIKYCIGSACQANGTKKNLRKLEETLSKMQENGGNSEKFTVEKVRCLGCCAVGPTISIDDDLYGNISQEKIEELLDKYK